jgi:hypothetical protein
VTSSEGSDDEAHDEAHARRRRLLRLASAVAAVALVAVLAAVLSAGHRSTSRSSAAFCKRISDVSALSDALASGDGTQIRAATERLHRAEQVAPPEIEPKVQVLSAYADGLTASIATAGNDPGAVDAALADAVRAQADQNATVVEAGNAVQYYTKATCDVDLSHPTVSNQTGG